MGKGRLSGWAGDNHKIEWECPAYLAIEVQIPIPEPREHEHELFIVQQKERKKD
jgi:hypothetical protein